MGETRQVGEEASKVQQLRLENGFFDTYLSGARILDIGYRGYIENVVPIVPQAIGVELDYPGYDGRTLPFADGSQDAVFASHCLEHIQDFVQALRDWFRVLRQGGYLVVMVPHQFLYEKRAALPSLYNQDHKRYYTPASLMGDIEAALPPNTYRLRHLADNDREFDYAIPPERHAGGCYEIELVIEKIASPGWSIVVQEPPPQNRSGFDAIGAGETAEIVHPQHAGTQRITVVPAEPWNLAVYDFGCAEPAQPRVLVLQLGHLGDFIIGLPALRQLRERFPGGHMRLVVGSWNRGVAEASGLADEVATYDYFPEVSLGWNGRPVQDAAAFAQAAPGRSDIAIDLRVDDDTRHLLQQVDAGMRCGIGSGTRFPFLDIVLPFDHALRSTDSVTRSMNVLLGPERFNSRMPVQTAFWHETDFSVTDTHVIYGPYLALPIGRFRAIFGLQLRTVQLWGMRLGRGRTRVTLDVVQGATKVLAQQSFGLNEIGEAVSNRLHLDFTNTDDTTTCEFRIHLRGKPLRATLAFSGIKLDQLESPAAPRFRGADLHIGEQESLLVQLVADRTRQLYGPPPDEAGRALPGLVPGNLAIPPGRSRVVVAPVSNSDLRDWPAAHYAALIGQLVEKLDCTVLLIGSRAQSGTLGHIVQTSGAGHRVVNLAGRTAWADIPDVLRTADLVICNNSGIAHLAASIGVRTLAIYSASHQPQEWGPRGAHARALMAVVPCSPCGFDQLSLCPHEHACMQGLLPDTVFAQAAAWLPVE